MGNGTYYTATSLLGGYISKSLEWFIHFKLSRGVSISRHTTGRRLRIAKDTGSTRILTSALYAWASSIASIDRFLPPLRLSSRYIYSRISTVGVLPPKEKYKLEIEYLSKIFFFVSLYSVYLNIARDPETISWQFIYVSGGWILEVERPWPAVLSFLEKVQKKRGQEWEKLTFLFKFIKWR